ncbi:transport and Golgi organization protein 1 isoform X2 [Ceratitis capitata]|uniref:transport and Golgi organization protein 1 isoform X2 n=1 Tax=Ceratitis capitata TaxID=7213 RepID=UPI0003297F9C|nr:transport and Golgi organization protein 1 isoform X2 [Ceratitis capitata]
MFGKEKCITLKSALVFLVVCSIVFPSYWVADGLSDYRLCADPKCQSIISLATGKISYTGGEEGMVSFKINSKIRVKSKSAGKDKRLWGIEVNGREGYAPKDFIQEYKVMVRDSDLSYEVPVPLPSSKAKASPENPEITLKPSENIGASTNEIESTTTTPLEQPLDEESILQKTSSDIHKSEDLIPTPKKIEVIDGTVIPVLENVSKLSSEKDVTINNGVPENVAENKKDIIANKDEAMSKENAIEAESNVKEVSENITLNSQSLLADDDDDDEDDDEDENDDDEFDDEGESVEEVDKLQNKINEDKKDSILPEINIPNSEYLANTINETINKFEDPTVPRDELHKNESTVSLIDKNESVEENFLKDSVEESATTPTAFLQNQTEGSVFEKDVEKVDDLRENEVSNLENKISAEDLQNKVQASLVQAIVENSTTIEDASVEVATEPSVTESGYQHYVHARDIEFDTTTIPTVILPNTQSPESQVSGSSEGPVISITNIDMATTNKEVPNESSETVPVPISSADVFLQENEPLHTIPEDITAQSLLPSKSSEISNEESVDENASNAERNVPTLPILQIPTQTQSQTIQGEPTAQEQIHTPEQQHTYQKQHQDPLSESHTQQNEIINETEMNTKETQNVNLESEILAQTPYFPESTLQNDINQDKTFEAPTLSTVHESTESNNGDILNSAESIETIPNNVEDIQNNDLNVDSHAPVDPDSITNLSVEEISHTMSTPSIVENSPSTSAPKNIIEEEFKEKDQGLFATILGTVNNFLSNGKKEDVSVTEDEELQRILFPDRIANNKKAKENDPEYCEKLSPNDCPSRVIENLNNAASTSSIAGCQLDINNMSMDMLLTVAGNKMFEMSELLACLATVAVTCLFFLFVYYCFCNSSREGELLAKLNALERSLLATHKENAILKEDLMGTRNKLSSIEDNSFGSNDMVIALKKELEEELLEKRQLQEQVGNLEKELENAAEAGLELNKIVSELLSNQTGDESIISSVEELQKQLNEQQKTILDINANLAEKSRENSELQLMIAEQDARLNGEITSLQQDNDELEVEKSNLQTQLEEVKREFEVDISKALEGKNFEIKRLQSELVELSTKLEADHTKYQTSLAKVEALEECLRTVRRDPNGNINQVIDVANVRAELIDVQKRYASLKERLDTETDGKKLIEEQLKLARSENEKLKHDFHQSEKDKLEAQTRLEVLSNYFKEKETQLQKELSLKEAMWLKQQGETTSTVDRVTTMQEEIQALKSQNDALRAEIEAQLAAHKAQTGTLENRAHETWLAARQSERRYEEARAEATALRRKLTSLAGVGGGTSGEANFEKLVSTELNNAPSPIHMESPGSPLMGRLPPPPFLPPPFMGPPPPFMGMPPPFVPPGEMRPPPLGRLMSPPPGAGSGGSGGSAHLPPPPQRTGRYSPNRTDYDDYDDDDDEDDYVDEDDEDEEEERMRRRRHRRGSDINGSWHRDDSYSPQPRAYRSQSPTDSRYNYNAERDLISTYDTETDFEPSPRKHEQRGARAPRAGSYRGYSPQPTASSPLNVSANSNAGKMYSATAYSKDHLSSGSEKSYNSPTSQRHGGKKGGKSAV